MKSKSRSIVILSIVFGYILLQFLWWEVLLVKQNSLIINEKQKIVELGATNETALRQEISELHHKKTMQTVMIVSEGTVFLLLLIFGIYLIKQSLDKETALNNQQRNFFLSVTHELKTPIAATKLQLQTLLKQKLDEGLQQRLLNNALNENERLNQLIDNILFASRLESDEFSVKKEKSDISSLINTTAQRYYAAELRDAILQLEIENSLFAEVDPFTFPSIITNLVDNAIKYSPAEKNIQVKLQQVGNQIQMSVSDQGIGISEEDKRKIFSKFFRSGQEDTRTTKGTGLGLYIVDYLIRKNGGKIKVLDNKPKGSIFVLSINRV